MVPTLSLLLALLAPSVDGRPQSERPEPVEDVERAGHGTAVEASTKLATPLSPADAAFVAELADLRELQASYERAQVDASFVVAERMPRFLELAHKGSGRAAAFALTHYPSLPGEFQRERGQKLDLYSTLERSYPGQTWLVERELDVFASLRRDAALLGLERARSLVRALRHGASSAVLRARSLLAEAHIELDEGTEDPSSRRRARALLREIVDLYPASQAAQEASEALWRMTHLQVGAVAPDFVGTDVDGNELRLSDWSRRVVVVDFWSEQDPAAAERLRARGALVERFGEERFALIGVNLDRNETAFRRAVEEYGVEWPNVFTGGTEERVIWKIRGPATFVLAPERVIQQVDPGDDALSEAVEQLIQEGKELGNQTKQGFGPPIR